MTCNQHRSTLRGRVITLNGENKRKASFRNPGLKKYNIVKVDQGVVTQQRAADYVLNQEEVGSLIVELKGSDVRHACRQVAATVELLNGCGFRHKIIAGLVVCTRFPAVDTTIQRLQNDFKRRVGRRLKVSSSQTEFNFSDLFL